VTAHERDLRVAYVVRSWPRLSQTFIVNEMLALEQLGLALVVFSMSHSGEPIVQERVGAVRAPIHSLDAARARPRFRRAAGHVRVLARSPRRYLGTLAFVVMGRQLARGYTTTTRAACFGHAVHIAATLHRDRASAGPVARIHAHFAHDPALVGLLAHRLTGISFSLTAHARDLYGIPEGTLATRTRAADAVVTCCRANADYLARTVGTDRLHLVHHGVDLDQFRPAPRSVDAGPPTILSVGRLVEKKGFADLLRASAHLQRTGVDFRLVICGDGPLRAELEQLRHELHIEERVELIGALPQHELVPRFQQADVFALVPLVAADGDRDGVPNVLVEAMACGVPVVTTAVGGIPDLVCHDGNGLVAQPCDIGDIAHHLAVLLEDEPRRRALGREARATVEAHFDARVAATRLATLFGARTREAG
jgi:glycosyltransferase involved in cell wall biosynthesis